MLKLANWIGQRYGKASKKWPYVIAGTTSSIVLTTADVVCQYFVQPPADDSLIDIRRTASLACFGAIWYGGPCKWLYLRLDTIFGREASAMNVFMKTFIDVYIHTPFALVPAFYLITNTIKGIPLHETSRQLQKEWFTASFGSVLFWTPMQAVNFYFIPQTFKVPFISCFSFCHKLWLSYLANYERYSSQHHDELHGNFTLSLPSSATTNQASSSTTILLAAAPPEVSAVSSTAE